MSDLISRKAAIEAVEDKWENAVSLEYERDIIISDTIEVLNAVPPAEKTRRWYIDAEGDVRCTACKTKCLRDDIGINILSIYCPKCGAKMEG